KLARQQSAESRKKLAPLTKKIKTLEAKIEKEQQQLQRIEMQLADAELYDDNHKDRLKICLAQQATSKKNLVALEEDWLETQEHIESMAEQ
ncbi:MAG: ABC transporter ATP-binding protein, partial [Porticoccaceae bacterium]